MKTQRIMAHRVVVGGTVHALSIAETDIGGYLLNVKPYERETANTEFRNGTVTFIAMRRRSLCRHKLAN